MGCTCLKAWVLQVQASALFQLYTFHETGGPWAGGHAHPEPLTSYPSATPSLCRLQSGFLGSRMPCTNGPQMMLVDLHSSCPEIHLLKLDHATDVSFTPMQS